MTKLNLLLLTLLVSFFSCKKVEVKEAQGSSTGTATSPSTPSGTPSPTVPVVKTYDTIKPLPYFPAFPGSHWIYVSYDMNGPGTSQVTYSTGTIYKKDAYSVTINGTQPIIYKSDTAYVPFFGNYGVWGSKLNSAALNGDPAQAVSISTLVEVVSDSLAVGYTWMASYSGSMNQQSTKIAVKDTSIVISGVTYYPTIVVQYFQLYHTSGNPITLASTSYYTKNIGLVKQGFPNGTGSQLVSYFINH